MQEIIIYKTPDGQAELEINLAEETVWLSLNQMAQLFQKDKSVISRHLTNIFKIKELDKIQTVAKFATVQKEGSREVSRQNGCGNNFGTGKCGIAVYGTYKLVRR